MSFESRLKGLQFGISVDPFRCLFGAPDSAWKTKKEEKKHFQMVGTKIVATQLEKCPSTKFTNKHFCWKPGTGK